ncbi:transcriptional adapter 2-alpha [Cimex lectularius]|uniref:Transcriptional adapter n=1 Tax=Cimex lectularius TaxID=79782 RepID=A0A8I6RBU5_CIMLE|nr:transcriptional adapter 2-alpha [Cimex lectularius]
MAAPNRIWMLCDDVKLLDGIIQFGFDNWNDISKYTGWDAKECEDRYIQRFITEPQNAELQELVKDWNEERKSDRLCPNNCFLSVPNKVNAYNYAKLVKLEDHLSFLAQEGCKKPPPIPHRRRFVNSYLPLPGHNPYRSDFDVEFDDKAEHILSLLYEPEDQDPAPVEPDKQDKQLIDEMKIALASIYNFRLSERFKRKIIIRNHALIDRRKTYNALQRFEISTVGKNLSTLLHLQRFISGPEFDYLYESLLHQNELKLRIQSYINYREQGIRFLSGIKTYDALNKKRSKYKAELRYNRIQLDEYGFRQVRCAAPLVLHNLPGYNLLEEGEKDLCSNARIIPETFYNFKQLLISECKKNNGLRLAQARQLIKIDVNKTRKIYDHLMSSKLIWQPR